MMIILDELDYCFMKIVLSCFSYFNHFIKKLKINLVFLTVCYDNACEYLFHPFQTFLSFHGIFHQTSSVYTSQQNEMEKCKNKHFIETTQTVLLHGHVPPQFWGDVVPQQPISSLYFVLSSTSQLINSLSLGIYLFVHNLSLGLNKL